MSNNLLQRRNFPDCEQCVLNLATQNLIPTDEESKPIFKKKPQTLIQLKQIFEQLGVLIVTSEGKIQFLTQQGEQLLRQYFSPDTLHSLPETLQHCFKHQIALSWSENKIVSPCLPLHIEQG